MIVSLLSGIIRNARNRRAAKKAQTEALNSLSDQQAQLDNIFNNEYYGDYMNRSDVQSMMRSIAAKQNNTAAIMGNTYSQIGANLSNWKNNVLNNYINNSMALNNQKYNLWAQQASDFRNAAHQSMTQALNSYTQIASAFMGGAGRMLGGGM